MALVTDGGTPHDPQNRRVAQRPAEHRLAIEGAEDLGEAGDEVDKTNRREVVSKSDPLDRPATPEEIEMVERG